jgi:hypothetical protein
LIPIMSLRGNDTKADDCVLPAEGANIILMEDAKHIDMCDRGSEEVKVKMIEHITHFLDGKL